MFLQAGVSWFLRRATRSVGVAAFTLAFVAARRTVAQVPGELRGRITDATTGRAIAGARIEIADRVESVRSDADGAFVVRGLEPKTYGVAVRAVGYAAFRRDVSVENGRTELLDAALDPVPTPLAVVVPRVASWRLAGLPIGLTPAQVQDLLAACDQSTAVGRRDFAVVTLLARLGLRAGEVAALRLDDIDWRTGTLTVHGKANSHEQLPLPVDVGSALSRYLEHGRPTGAAGRAVFIRDWERSTHTGFVTRWPPTC